MKILSPINQHIPIWSVLHGDHACHDLEGYLNPKLIEKPDFMNNKENALRSEYLRTTKGRKWLHELLQNKSFALVELETKDITEASTVFKNIGLIELTKQYVNAYKNKTGFEFKKLKKTKADVLDVKRRQRDIPLGNEDDWSFWLTDTSDEDLAYHRTIWMKKQDGKLQLLDGTHRMLAICWQNELHLEDRELNHPTYGIVFNE